MKAFRWISCIVILSMVFGMCANPQTVKAQPLNQDQINRSTPYVPGEVVVAFKGGGASAQYNAQATALAGQVSAQVVGSFGNAALLSFAPDADVQALSKQLASAQGVQFAEPNYISWIPEADAKIKGIQKQLSQITHKSQNGKKYQVAVKDLLAMRSIVRGKSVPTYANDMFSSWGVWKTNANVIWTETFASPQVCVLDTGVDMSHPDLAKKVVAGWDFINNDSSVVDDNGHGTHVTGTIAAKVNDGIGPAGISNGQVLAVKVMTAQGWGTDFDIAEGIEYCANSASVKVLSMSLGGPKSDLEYTALDYAINTKGKLVVAAAGNDSTDLRDNAYPAAWSDDPPSGQFLGLGQGIISVAAARSPWTNGGDGTISVNGNDYSDCATDFSNYGAWVNIVAPGEDIYSTTPYSSPFWLNYYKSVSPKYDYLSGTSMATPHVAAAAARVWSVYKTLTNSQMKGKLISSGTSLNYAMDPEFVASDQTQGYSGPYDSDDFDGPFCWPSIGTGAVPAADMSSATYLDVAAAMGRGAIEAHVLDATTGLPLVGGTLQALIDNTKTIKASSTVPSPYSGWVDLIDLPINYTYTLTVSASGYTSGVQPYMIHMPVGGKDTEGNNLTWQFGPWVDIPVPPNNKNFTVVANWWNWDYELGLFLWLPQNESGVIGPWNPYTDTNNPLYLGAGTLLASPSSPFARLYRLEESEGLGLESIGVVSSGAYPMFNSATQNQIYDVFLSDNNNGHDLNDSYPRVRVWYGGKPNWLSVNPQCSDGDNWWHVGSFYRSGNGMLYNNINTCGTGEVIGTGTGNGVWPYSTKASVTIKSSNQTAK